jgi:cell division ATPase FtsA
LRGQKRKRSPAEKAEKYKMRYGTCECEDDDLIHMTKKGDKIINYTQRDLSFLVNESVEELMMQVKNKIELINNGRAYETIIVGGGAELPLIENVSSNVLGTSVRVYRPDTVGARDTQYVSCLGMIYYLNDRTKIIGGYEPSIVMSDISNTMSYRLKGLTVVKDNENVKKKRISKVLDSIFGEDKE